jgi:hypothetical protein
VSGVNSRSLIEIVTGRPTSLFTPEKWRLLFAAFSLPAFGQVVHPGAISKTAFEDYGQEKRHH